MAEEKKFGRQTPTTSVVLPYKTTKGPEAVKLYNATSKKVLEWQELLIYDLMAVNDDGLWTHSRFGYSLPRRNGKSEIVIIRELYGLLTGEKILYTAHRTTTSHSAWERLVSLINDIGLVEGKDYKALKQVGLEEIRLYNGGGRINFRTRTAKGGLGEGFDLLVIDEAQEYTDDQESALKYVVTDSKNPQTLFCGTPPTTVSSGTVFLKLRKNTLAGDAFNTGWAEWSVEYKRDPKDRDLWYETNPSLGYIFSERAVQDEVGTDDIDFNIQRLGLWLQYNQKSAISKVEWKELEVDQLPELKSDICVAVKYGHDNTNVSLSLGCKTTDGKIFIETLDCQPIRNGNDWILQYIKALKPRWIVIDGANGQRALADELSKNKIKGAVLPTVKEIINANNIFEQAIFSKEICHANQPSLEQAVSNCEKRGIGSNGGFGYKAQKEGIEIGILDSAILAFWACSKVREKRKQRISY